jgi:hypothetical protein
LVRQHPLYPVREAFTYFTRDDVVHAVSQANVPTDDLMGGLIDGIWGAR